MLKKWMFWSALCLSCHANAMDAFLLGGGTYSNLSNGNTTLRLNDSVINQYDSNNQANLNLLGGIGVGYTFLVSPIWQLSTYLSGYVVGMGKVEGTKDPLIDSDIHFDPLNYEFKVNSYALMLESRLAFMRYPLQPFILAGLGGSWNVLFSYSEEPTGTSSPAPQNFSNHGQGAFAYQVGAGLQYDFLTGDTGTPTWQVSLDYRYMNFGKGSLGEASIQTTDQTLEISNIHTQAVVLTLHFVV